MAEMEYLMKQEKAIMVYRSNDREHVYDSSVMQWKSPIRVVHMLELNL